MILQKATRKRAKIKMALQGPSGSGKTYSSLQIAYGLCGDWSKIAVIDTENGSAELYSHLGEYNVIGLLAPHSPERYSEAIDICIKAGIEVIIIDSTTHEWEYLLSYHDSLPGNSFTNWSKVTPRHNTFIQKILFSPCHIISTIRTKTDYVMTEKNGRPVPEKVGLKSVQRDGLDYEMTLVFDLDIKNNATASKDRTGLFANKPEHKISVDTGKIISDWCNNGTLQADKMFNAEQLETEDALRGLSYCGNLADLKAWKEAVPEHVIAYPTVKAAAKAKHTEITTVTNLPIE
jgi:hypothetical protein